MKLLKQVSRTYGKKTYHKHWIVIPNEIVKELRWNVGDDLRPTAKDKKLIIEKEKVYGE